MREKTTGGPIRKTNNDIVEIPQDLTILKQLKKRKSSEKTYFAKKK